MYHVSKQLVDIVKPMVHNEFHNAKDLYQRYPNHVRIQLPPSHKIEITNQV